MVSFWLDANVFIAPFKQGFYDFDVAPSFWNLLVQRASDGQLASVSRVYDELAHGEDPLADWIRRHSDTSLFLEPDEEVQRAMGRVATYVTGRYDTPQVVDFLAGADPWLIAHAIAKGGKVVTFERRIGSNSSRIKIPNVCDHFRIETISLYQMFTEANIVLEFRS